MPSRKMGEIDKIERTRIGKAFQWNKQPRALGFPNQFRLCVCSTPSVPYNQYKPTRLRSWPKLISSRKNGRFAQERSRNAVQRRNREPHPAEKAPALCQHPRSRHVPCEGNPGFKERVPETARGSQECGRNCKGRRGDPPENTTSPRSADELGLNLKI